MPDIPRSARRISGTRVSIMGELVRKSQTLTAAGADIINLGPGIPDFPAARFLKDAAAAAVRADANGYGNAWGDARLRRAIAERFHDRYGVYFCPQSETTITAGASAALNAILLALINPGERVIVFEPYFENFIPQIALAGGVPRFVPLMQPDWALDERALSRAFSARTKLLVLNTPNNPTGRVFSAAELERIAYYCRKHDVIVVSDATYEPFTYEGKHVPMAGLPGMRERTVTVGSVSKVFNVSGWRIGHVLAPADLTAAIRKVNDLSLGAPTPLQEACLPAMEQYERFTGELVRKYRPLRDQLSSALSEAGWRLSPPQGTFFIFAQAPEHLGSDSMEICHHLLEEKRILAVPGASFFRAGSPVRWVRFCFARRAETIERACRLLAS